MWSQGDTFNVVQQRVGREECLNSFLRENHAGRLPSKDFRGLQNFAGQAGEGDTLQQWEGNPLASDSSPRSTARDSDRVVSHGYGMPQGKVYLLIHSFGPAAAIRPALSCAD